VKQVYFDRNVFADIYGLRRGLTESDVMKLQNAVDTGAIVIPASYTVIEETVSLLRDRGEEEYKAQMRSVLNLIDKTRMVKAHHELIRDDLLSFAYQRSFVRTTAVPENFERILDLSIDPNGVQELAEEIRAFYDHAATKRQKDFDRLIAETTEKGFTGFNDFPTAWAIAAPIIVDSLVSRLPREAKRLCKKHGLGNLLNIKSIGMAVTYESWLLYSHWLRGDGSRGKVKASEQGDFFHAISASAADIFVTEEHKEKYGRLPYILSQVPIKRLTIMNLKELLHTLTS